MSETGMALLAPAYNEHGERINEALAELTRRVMAEINACTPGARLADVPTLFAFGPTYRALAEVAALASQPQRTALERVAAVLSKDVPPAPCPNEWDEFKDGYIQGYGDAIEAVAAALTPVVVASPPPLSE